MRNAQLSSKGSDSLSRESVVVRREGQGVISAAYGNPPRILNITSVDDLARNFQQASTGEGTAPSEDSGISPCYREDLQEHPVIILLATYQDNRCKITSSHSAL